MIRVAVLGSCATRDVFNSQFNPTYKDNYECVITQNQTSLISLMAHPVDVDRDDIDNLNEYDTWNVRTDFTKEFLQKLVVEKPDYLIIDLFADVHFGCLALPFGNYLTNNRWKLWKTRWYKEHAAECTVFNIDVDWIAYFSLWRDAANRLFSYINKYLKNCRVIIHKVRNVDYYLSSGQLKRLSTSGRVKEIDVDFYNYAWNEMNIYLINTFNLKSIDLWRNKNYISFEDHPWGPFYVHYTMDYYADFLTEFNRLVFGL
ncbi:MAG: DUF6270 domain-containing protein [Alicyclobacillus herbarius]|uniref:DUF6270 domain-containing protein n=1 Tax=Alicyclobacillus herbarius TaxID=122960 RepID=UPI003B5ADFB0|nr:DUF6270 domain-containing protein [Alicyclobacillus herbarius]